MKFPIYLDYAATTPTDPKVKKIMNKYYSINDIFGNAASRSHKFGWEAEESVDIARNEIAKLINSDSREIIFTSGATESNNLAIKGIYEFHKNKKNHIITSQIEHKSVLDCCRYLEYKGCHVTYIKPNKYGIIDISKIKEAINEHTLLISIMHVNNEIGSIQNIKKISHFCREKKIFFHVDATQSIGKIKIDIKKTPIDLLSFSAHKIYGPKGIGALYVCLKPRIRLSPQIHGGGHERGFRSGTLPVHQIVGFGEACKILRKKMKDDILHTRYLRNILWNGLRDIQEIYLNSHFDYVVNNILNISFNYIEGESLLMALKNLAVSSGSACTSASLEPSYVLRAIGVKDELAHSSIRFSIGRFTTSKDIKYAIIAIKNAIEKLRKLSPLWEMFQSGIKMDKIIWS
ncbi:Cysteine desulfurase IscS [Buchnera aphidicola (Cinara kochiana kochiana)]|uniref:Cysteine desulfurase IscS n=1 Tax=Buchnera aphidicola (Cinara kochiana kochiana) TaxID=2518976 RepID=A0A451D657_9GAMM|nr:IscS subfamily cysteine desulfurase [Buchnera aphidicola]VFP81292.1 Cysteine desulfurase IscS [Buchnera aphidicola (Cinara kochiana kochiana)]